MICSIQSMCKNRSQPVKWCKKTSRRRNKEIHFKGYKVSKEEKKLLYELMKMINVEKSVTVLELMEMVIGHIEELECKVATRLKYKLISKLTSQLVPSATASDEMMS